MIPLAMFGLGLPELLMVLVMVGAVTVPVVVIVLVVTMLKRTRNGSLAAAKKEGKG